ncbi:MAG TPA: tRNA-dihydrouridine synthase family protein [Nitrospirota bacterium]|nr:tRNA-dihydrouridine synthase family protein [Nitrospirota bacterium]
MKTPVPKIQIRHLVLDPPLLLAPMAGLTHSALRQILLGFGGVGLLSTEMLGARRVPNENPGVSPYLIRTPAEKPLSYQLLVASADEIGPAVDALHKLKADALDLNMGCPAPSVRRIGAGIRLMEMPGTVRAIVREARRRTELPLSAKIRIGSNADDRGFEDFCAMLQDEGIDLLSIHARYKHESFARRPRWETIAQVKKRLSIPIIANGGIFTTDDARQCLRLSGADGLMLGRGAAMKPWLFAEIARTLYGCDTPEPEVVLPDLYFTYIDNLCALFRPEHRLGRLKEFTHYFAKNYTFGHHLASRVQSSASMEEASERARVFFESRAE